MQAQDHDLVQLFLDGDGEALRSVDTWISQAAWPYRQRLASDWEDILQDARLELTRLLGSGAFRGESSLKTYLWRVVNHTCIDRLRRRARWQWQGLEDLDHRGVLSTGSGQSERRALRDLMLQVVERTPEECRLLWRMVLEGFSYREMSERLSVSEATLRVRVLRCRKRAIQVRDRLLQGVTTT